MSLARSNLRVPRARQIAVAVVIVAATLATGALRSTARAEPHVSACRLQWRVFARSASVPVLSDVAALSATDVWAVGGRSRSDAKPVIVHWDGQQLRPFKAFTPRGRYAELEAVAAVARDDVWAVGDDGGQPVLLHWNGREWRRQRPPQLPADASLRDVAAFARDDVWVVGGFADLIRRRPLVLRWNGRVWQRLSVGRVAPPGSSLLAIDGNDSTDIWAVGLTGVGITNHAKDELVLRWHRGQWKRMRTPLAGENQSPGAVDVSGGEVWAAHFPWGGRYGAAIVRWHGAVGRISYSTDEDLYLADIAATSQSDAWAVGYRDFDRHPLLLRWNGRSWRIVPTPLDRLVDAALESVSVVSPREIWAVGERVIARYSC
jgi:hypothetical protein